MDVREKILIADDSKMNQQILTDILGDRYEYLYADDGIEALEVLHSHVDVGLVLLDINMPRLDGFGVLEVMKQRSWIEEVPVIIISAENGSNFIKKAYDLGATDYISRPFNLTVVRRRVSNTLMLYDRQRHLVQLAEEQDQQRRHQYTQPRCRIAQLRIGHPYTPRQDIDRSAASTDRQDER